MTTRAAFRLGADRLLDRLTADYGEDGTALAAPDDIQLYYKLPAAFALGGRRAFAGRIVDAFVKRFVDDGNLRLDQYSGPWKVYVAGWAAWGAGSLSRFDAARLIMGTALGDFDPSVGAFRSEIEGRQVFDTVRTSGAAMGLIWAMDLDRARGIARFLKRAVAEQSRPRHFDTLIDKDGNPVATEDRMSCFAADDEWAYPAIFGTTVASLTWLGRVTEDDEFFRLAHQYVQVVLSSDHDPSKMPLATKLGWAALMLSRHVDDPALLRFAEGIGESLLQRQREDGSLDFEDVPDVPKPIDRDSQVGWSCDAVTTLIALGDGGS